MNISGQDPLNLIKFKYINKIINLITFNKVIRGKICIKAAYFT